MITQTLIWAICGLVIGGIVTFIFCRIIMQKPTEAENVATPDKDALEEQRKKYESLLAEANEKCSELDSQLKAALDGKIDISIQKQLASIDKLKKKIKGLEDDLDEKEDDLDDAKKKMSRMDSEIATLQDTLHTEQKASKALHVDLEQTKQKLDDTVSELELKAGSLGFVQEILSAKDSSTDDVAKLTKNIDQMEAFIKGQYLDLNAFLYHGHDFTWNNVAGQAGFNIKKDFFLSAFEQWASTKRKSWLDGKTTIAFVGEFSAGKTSIVNRILSQDNPDVPRLPVSAKATTAIPTYIAGGLKTSYSFISGDGRQKTILENTFKNVSKDILGQIKGTSSLIKYFVMTYNNPNLKGLSILDTPGFNSNDKEDSIRTIEVINECDALFWVVDVNNGNINQTSETTLETIKKNLNKPLFIVINKVDTKANTEVDKVEELIRNTLADAGLSVVAFIRFSKQTPLNVIMEPIKTVSKNSIRDTFLSDIDDDINQLLTILYNKRNEQRVDYDAAIQEGESIKENFIYSINKLKSDCEEASELPAYQEASKIKKWFNIDDDKYVMTVQEYQLHKERLSTIAGTRVNQLQQNFEKMVEKAEDIQLSWTNFCDTKAVEGRI